METGLPKARGLGVAPAWRDHAEFWMGKMGWTEHMDYKENCSAVSGGQGELPAERGAALLCVRSALGSQLHLQVEVEHPAFPREKPAGNSHSGWNQDS